MRFIGYIYLLFIFQAIACQVDSVKIVQYTPDFEFNDGFYLNFDQVRNNKPILKSKIVSKVNYNAPNFFDAVIASRKIVYYDNLGSRIEINIDKIWGYAKNGSLYININGIFNRITVVGRICHFIATIKINQPAFYDPFMGGIGISPMSRSGNESTEIRQLILDFDTGKLYEYSIESIELILARDPDLYSEFSLLKKRKKKQLKFVYLRKYNDKHPLYFPVQQE